MSESTEVTLLDHDDGPILVTDLLDAIAKTVARMPEEVRASAFIKLDAYGDYASAYLNINRPPTKAEQEAEERRYAEMRAEDEERAKQRERREFERLKAKFEGTK